MENVLWIATYLALPTQRGKSVFFTSLELFFAALATKKFSKTIKNISNHTSLTLFFFTISRNINHKSSERVAGSLFCFTHCVAPPCSLELYVLSDDPKINGPKINFKVQRLKT